jgi:membrane-associated protease RseP (regulator of RpoE activity)
MRIERDWRGDLVVALATVFCGFSVANQPVANAQVPAAARAAVVIVDGMVQNVFQSGDQDLVQILVQRSELPRLDAIGSTSYPAPGQLVYVHVTDQAAGRISRAPRGGSVPSVKSRITAYLSVGRDGQWEAAGADWFTDDRGSRSASAADSLRAGLGASDLGVRCQRVSIGRDIGLKVTNVSPGSPAAKAGLELGDVLTKVGRLRVESEDQLAEAYRNSRGDFWVTVRDVNSGREVPVNITAASDASRTPAGLGRMQPLGATGELAFYNGEAAVKVTAVEPGSPAQKAGLAAGLLILKSNGKAIESVKALEQAERDSRGTMDLLIVDPKTKRERTVRATL